MKHKYYVCKYCWKVGLYWQGLVHDLSKFSIIEMKAGIRYYSGEKSPNSIQKKVEGYSIAWIHHKNHNKHHSEYWTDFSEEKYLINKEKITPIEMPDKYLVEMLCDRIAACKTYKGNDYHNDDPLNYYYNQQESVMMHETTKAKLQELRTILAEEGEEKAFGAARLLLNSNSKKKI